MLAHYLIRWTSTIGKPVEQLTVARNVRTQLIALPGRIVNRSGIPTLRLPAPRPWAEQFTDRLEAIRTLPLPTG